MIGPPAAIVGKIYEGKGQKEAVLAAARLAPRYPSFKLLVIGEAADERYARRLKEIVASQGLADRVVFAGYRRDLVDPLKIVKAVVVASVVESFGRVVLEAMAAGVPVVAVRAGGVPEIIRHGENGFLVESNAPDELARGLAYVFDHPAEAKAAADAGYRTVRDGYSLEKQVRDVERVVADALGIP